jgi:16S rRNA (guanine527-N7)-methyltransferase
VQEGLNVSRETQDRIARFCDMVLQWNSTINLIAPLTVAHLYERHVMDSAQLTKFAPDDFGAWLDIGSGGGFPGIVIAAMLAETAPSARVVLVESDKRKSVFLTQAIRALYLQTTVIAERIERVDPQEADVISARALAPLPKLLGLAAPHLRPGGICIFPKGQNCEAEIADARRDGWHFVADRHKSETDPNGTILVLRNIARDACT